MNDLGEAFVLARQHHKEGRIAQAEREYAEILRHAPQFADALHGRAIIALQAGNLDVAADFARAAIGSNGGIAKFHNTMGLVLYGQTRINEAIGEYERALVLDPGMPTVQMNLAVAYYGAGRFTQAVYAVRQALAADPDDTQAAQNLDIFMKDPRVVAALGKKSVDRAQASDFDEFQYLVDQFRDGVVKIAIDRKQILHPHCPVAGDSIETLPVYLGALVIAGLLFYDYNIAGAVFVAMILLHVLFGRRWLDRRIHKYVTRKITASLELWDKLWKFGGVTLTAPTVLPEVTCKSPDQKWRSFIERLNAAQPAPATAEPTPASPQDT